MGVTSYKLLKEQGFGKLLVHAGTLSHPVTSSYSLVENRFNRDRIFYGKLVLLHYPKLVVTTTNKLGETKYNFTKAIELFKKFVP